MVDPIQYKQVTAGLNQTVIVMSIEFPEVKQVYDKLFLSLCKYYQPIEIAFCGGVYAETADYAGYIQNIGITEGQVEIKLFGDERVLRFPSECSIPALPEKPLLEPLPYNVEQTHHFSKRNYMYISNRIVEAWIDENGIPFIMVDNDFHMKGDLVAYTDDVICCKTNSSYHITLLSDAPTSALLQKLPQGIDCVLVDGELKIITRLSDEEQVLNVYSVSSHDQTLHFIVSTQENPFLKFELEMHILNTNVALAVAGVIIRSFANKD